MQVSGAVQCTGKLADPLISGPGARVAVNEVKFTTRLANVALADAICTGSETPCNSAVTPCNWTLPDGAGGANPTQVPATSKSTCAGPARPTPGVPTPSASPTFKSLASSASPLRLML